MTRKNHRSLMKAIVFFWSGKCAWIFMFVSVIIAAEASPHCYSCRGKLYGGDEVNCFDPDVNTTVVHCEPHQLYCKKKLVEAGGNLMVERGCYEMCQQQVDITMGQEVYIDVYCCQGDLCNLATSAHPDVTGMVGVVGFVAWMIYR